MGEEVSQMNTKLKDLEGKVRDLREKIYGPVKNAPVYETGTVLVHYTSLVALIGMITGSKSGMRAYQTGELTDQAEGRVRGADREIANILENSESGGWCRQRYTNAAVTCFVLGSKSESVEDELLFWQLYGGNGTGVSIAIAEQVTQKWMESRVVEAVDYGNQRVEIGDSDRTLMRTLVGRIDEMAGTVGSDPSWTRVREECDEFFKQRFLAKRKAYAHEREVRSVKWAYGTDEGEYHPQAMSAGIKDSWEYAELQAKNWLESGTTITLGRNINDWEKVSKTINAIIEEHHGPAARNQTRVARSHEKFGPTTR